MPASPASRKSGGGGNRVGRGGASEDGTACKGILPEKQGWNLALIFVDVPYSLDSGALGYRSEAGGGETSTRYRAVEPNSGFNVIPRRARPGWPHRGSGLLGWGFLAGLRPHRGGRGYRGGRIGNDRNRGRGRGSGGSLFRGC